MRNRAEVLSRLDEIKANVALLEEKIEAELKKTWLNRNGRLLLFLNREQNILKFALTQLEWLLAEN